MARNINEIKDLARHAVKGTAPVDFSASAGEINSVVKEEIRALAADYNLYRRNKLDIFEILQEAIDIALPKAVLDRIGQFAEVRNFKSGETVQFKVKKGRARGKRFVTRAAESGVYRAFRLDSDTFGMETYALGNAGYVDFGRWMRGEEDLGEISDIIMESFEDALYEDILKALEATVESAKMPTANRVVDNQFSADGLAQVCNTVKAYGEGAVIFATPAFVAEMDSANAIANQVSATDLEDVRTKGYIGMFRGCPIVQLPNSFVDETNTAKVFKDSIAYVFPTGGEKVVKVAIEGNTIVKDWENRDNSMEIQAYKNVGVAITSYHNWGIYVNEELDA